MAKQKNKSISEEERLNEIKMLSEKAKEISGKQSEMFEGIDLGDEDIDASFNTNMLDDTADPDKSHRLYYTMMMTMRSNLPKGKKNEKLRRYVYDEKSLFLNRGKQKDEKGIRGSDERMAYIGNFLQVAFDVVHKWVSEGANPYDLYTAFYELNNERGYHAPKEDSKGDFDTKLTGLLNTPPPKEEKKK